MLGNSSYTASRALFRDVVFAGPPGMIQVSLNYEERGALTPGGTGWR